MTETVIDWIHESFENSSFSEKCIRTVSLAFLQCNAQDVHKITSYASTSSYEVPLKRWQ